MPPKRRSTASRPDGVTGVSRPEAAPDGDEDPPDDPGGGWDPFDAEDEAPPAASSWLGAIGQLAGAVLVVAFVVAFFIAATVALRRLLP
ncbi:MAG TPA: hypothetical protein VGB87_21710 [Vicinamibacteria bacterium]